MVAGRLAIRAWLMDDIARSHCEITSVCKNINNAIVAPIINNDLIAAAAAAACRRDAGDCDGTEIRSMNGENVLLLGEEGIGGTVGGSAQN